MAVPSRNVSEDLMASGDLTEDECYRLLESRRRRVVLLVLAGQEDSLSVEELSRKVAKAENDDVTPTPGETPEDIQIELHHVHLPLLADYGVVEYDWTTRRVEP